MAGPQHPILRGLKFLFLIAIGWNANSSQEIATNLLIIVGFFIEGIVLHEAIMRQATADFLPTFGIVRIASVIAFAFVAASLFFHQFVIFRNFSLSPGAGVNSKERKQRWLEVALYVCFGVLTGEVGYLLTVVREHNPSSRIADAIVTLFGTRKPFIEKELDWLLTLECAFLLGAISICFFVLVWDAFVRSSPNTNSDDRAWLETYWRNDLTSLAFWICLLTVVTPRARWQFGVRFDPIRDLGTVIVLAWIVIGASSLSYVIMMSKRLKAGLNALAAEESYAAARLKKI